MYILIAAIFLLGYLGIAAESVIKINKAAVALFTAVTCWTVFIVMHPNGALPEELIEGHDGLMSVIGEIGGLIFFLIGAMTIVELVDSHDGFDVVTNRIRTTDKAKLLWIVCIVTFFMSAVLDNMTTTIVMIMLLKKLMEDEKDLWFFSGFVIIAANAGGAFSPVGDVSTIILWIHNKVTAGNIILHLLLPSLVCLLLPLAIATFRMNGNVTPPVEEEGNENQSVERWESKLILVMGVGALLFVPIFKAATHLPPIMGVLLGLSVMWVLTEFMHQKKETKFRERLSITAVLKKIDTTSLMYLLGVLLAVGAIRNAGILADLATQLHLAFGDNIYGIDVLTGLVSAIVDNSALVAAASNMFDYGTNHPFWTLLALAAGTGGSCLIIGSAAGVATMGLTGMTFGWYLKNISLYALIGYFGGIFTFWVISLLF
jgi:Na+/H+ antiporter NhaD/arsenite permease-like protein